MASWILDAVDLTPDEPPLKHNPDCEYWFENRATECTCGLTKTRPDWSELTPWPDDKWAELVKTIKAP